MGRTRKNHRPDLNGLLVIDKPLGLTSMTVCRAVRRRTGGAKTGHAGTLDPLATGVLVVCLGKATKHIEQLNAAPKRYTAQVDLAAFSPTDDMESEGEPVAIARPPTSEEVRTACARFVGEIQQRPPVFSAVQIGGQRAYDLARRGRLEERPDAKPVVIHAIDVLAYEWPALTLDVRCGKGVYIRSLARDLGEALGTGGRLTGLRRTESGGFTERDATPLDDLPEEIGAEDLRGV